MIVQTMMSSLREYLTVHCVMTCLEPCPDRDCSGHGSVTEGKCRCDDGYESEKCDRCASTHYEEEAVRGVLALISFSYLLTQRTHSPVTYTTNKSHPCHSLVSLTRNNITRMLRKYLSRASRSNTGTLKSQSRLRQD